MNTQLSTDDWLSLPVEMRAKLRLTFGIPQSKGSIIEYAHTGAVVKSDGTTYADLAHLTSEKMKQFLGIEEDKEFSQLVKDTISKITEDSKPPKAPEVDTTQLIVDEWTSLLTRLKVEADSKQMSHILDAILKRVFDLKPTVITQYEKRKPGRPKKAK